MERKIAVVIGESVEKGTCGSCEWLSVMQLFCELLQKDLPAPHIRCQECLDAEIKE